MVTDTRCTSKPPYTRSALRLRKDTPSSTCRLTASRDRPLLLYRRVCILPVIQCRLILVMTCGTSQMVPGCSTTFGANSVADVEPHFQVRQIGYEARRRPPQTRLCHCRYGRGRSTQLRPRRLLYPSGSMGLSSHSYVEHSGLDEVSGATLSHPVLEFGVPSQ